MGTNGASWFDVVNVLDSSYTFSENVVPGTVYQFRVRAQNKYGYGPFSLILTTQAANVPAQPLPVTTSTQGANILISWTPPNAGSSAITQYDIEFRIHNSASTYYSVLPYCDGT